MRLKPQNQIGIVERIIKVVLVVLSVLTTALGTLMIAWLWALVAFGMCTPRNEVWSAHAVTLAGLGLAHIVLGFLMAWRFVPAYILMMIVAVLEIVGLRWTGIKLHEVGWLPLVQITLALLTIFALMAWKSPKRGFESDSTRMALET